MPAALALKKSAVGCSSAGSSMTCAGVGEAVQEVGGGGAPAADLGEHAVGLGPLGVDRGQQRGDIGGDRRVGLVEQVVLAEHRGLAGGGGRGVVYLRARSLAVARGGRRVRPSRSSSRVVVVSVVVVVAVAVVVPRVPLLSSSSGAPCAHPTTSAAAGPIIHRVMAGKGTPCRLRPAPRRPPGTARERAWASPPACSANAGPRVVRAPGAAPERARASARPRNRGTTCPRGHPRSGSRSDAALAGGARRARLISGSVARQLASPMPLRHALKAMSPRRWPRADVSLRTSCARLRDMSLRTPSIAAAGAAEEVAGEASRHAPRGRPRGISGTAVSSRCQFTRREHPQVLQEHPVHAGRRRR